MTGAETWGLSPVCSRPDLAIPVEEYGKVAILLSTRSGGAARFSDKSFATHPFRKERGQGWGTLIVDSAEKGWSSPCERCRDPSLGVVRFASDSAASG